MLIFKLPFFFKQVSKKLTIRKNSKLYPKYTLVNRYNNLFQKLLAHGYVCNLADPIGGPVLAMKEEWDSAFKKNDSEFETFLIIIRRFL